MNVMSISSVMTMNATIFLQRNRINGWGEGRRGWGLR